MTHTALLEGTLQFLNNAPIVGQNSDTKIRNLLKAEYLRSLARYRHTDFMLSSKYGMCFDEFVKQRVVLTVGTANPMRWDGKLQSAE